MNKVLEKILIQPHVISAEGLRFLNDFAGQSANSAPVGVFAPENYGTGFRNDKIDENIRDTQAVDFTPIMPEVRELMHNVVHRVVNPFYNFKIKDSELPQLLKYEVGGHYKPHYDGVAQWRNPDGSVIWKKSVDRDLSSVIFLNDDFEGGDFVFPHLRIRIRPEPGLMVCFPSTEDYLHQVEPVTKGTRYSLVTWFTVHGFKTLQEVDEEIEQKYNIKLPRHDSN